MIMPYWASIGIFYNKMTHKSIIAIVLLLFSFITYAYSEENVYVFSRDGGVFVIHLEENPQLVYSDDAVTIQTEKQCITFKIEELRKVSFSIDYTTPVERTDFSQVPENVDIYNLSGQFLQRTNKIEMQSLPSGIYIIRQGQRSVVLNKSTR